MAQQETNPWDDSAFTETVADEAPTAISFDHIGETFKGTFIGRNQVTDPNTGKTWWSYLFRAAPNQDGLDENELCALGGYAIEEAMGDGEAYLNLRTRLQYVKDVDTKKGAPMKSVKVQVAR